LTSVSCSRTVRPPERVNPRDLEPSELAPAEAAIGCGEQEHPVVLFDGVGQVDDLGGREEPHFACSLSGKANTGAGRPE
jgi:hypothetical protein